MSLELEIQETNFLTTEDFEKFIQTVPDIIPFKQIYQKPPMGSEQFQILYRLMYGEGLRVTEALQLQVKDLDLDNLILTIKSAKTGFKKCKCSKWEKRKLVSSDETCDKCHGLGKKRVPQYTTILPNDAVMLRKYIKKYHLKEDDHLFHCTRQTSRKYGKMAAELAGLNIFEQQDEKSIDGFWNHLLRKCRAKQMRRDGAEEELVMLKLRHSFSNVTFRYTKPDINYLKAWESKKYPLMNVVV